MPSPGLGAGDTKVTGTSVLGISWGETQEPDKLGTHQSISDMCKGKKWRQQKWKQRPERLIKGDNPGQCSKWDSGEGKGPRAGELGVLKEHLGGECGWSG